MKTVTLRNAWLHPGAQDRRVRDAFASVLYSWVGLGPRGNGERLEAYAAALYPHDDRNTALSFAKSQSTCARTSLSACEAIGARMPWTLDPYARHNTKAVGMIISLGKTLGTWVQVLGKNDAPPPGPGCVVFVGGVNGEAEHLSNVVADAPAYGPDAVTCIDGGQPDVDGPDDDTELDGGIQTLTRRFGPLSKGGPMRVWKLDPKARIWSAGRHVQGYFDVASLRLDADAIVPDEFDE